MKQPDQIDEVATMPEDVRMMNKALFDSAGARSASAEVTREQTSPETLADVPSQSAREAAVRALVDRLAEIATALETAAVRLQHAYVATSKCSTKLH